MSRDISIPNKNQGILESFNFYIQKQVLSKILLFALVLATGVIYAQNPTVQNGVATYHSNKNIGKKFKVPDSWDKILIKENVTITGSFYMPTRKHPIEIAGKSRKTSIIQGDGSRPTDDGIKGRSYSAIRCDKSPDVYIHDLKITKPMKFHISAGFGNVTVERCDIIAGSLTHTTDGIHGGRGKTVVKDCYINCYDDALYTIECKLIENTTIVHNKNGGPFMTSWGAEVPNNHTCVIRNCTVIANSDDGYNHGVFSWSQKHDDFPQTIHVKIEGSFDYIINPGKQAATMYTIGRPRDKTGLKNATMKIDGRCLRTNSIDIRENPGSNKVQFVNCDDGDNNGGDCTINVKSSSTPATCDNGGTVTLNISDFGSRTYIKYKIGNGDYSANQGTSENYTINNVSPGTYTIYAAWGNGDCPDTEVGSVTVGEDCNNNGGDCTINVNSSTTPATCDTGGTVTLNVSDFGSRTKIKYKIGNGDYSANQGTSENYTINNVSLGTYTIYAAWGNGDCPDTEVGSVTVG
ncbi:hypothetical protein ACWGOQ_0000005, partial [Aquimarina sp. M1]